MLAWLALAWTALAGGMAAAHEVQPSIAVLEADGTTATMTFEITAESHLAGIDLSQVTDTNDAPEAQAAEYDRLRSLPEAELATLVRSAWPDLAGTIDLDGAGALALRDVTVDDPGDFELARTTTVTTQAPIGETTEELTFSWAAERGPVILRQEQGDQLYGVLLENGEASDALPTSGVLAETAEEAAVRFLIAGIEHIIPLGIDHILFVLGLFFFALRLGPLLWQVTAFTLAHTITLALATLGYITIPDDWMWLVEAIIALSITYVAVENILRPKLGWWRPAVVFGFGLLHGLGFASVLQEFGLSQGQFVVSLVAFNVGVEVGQLLVILAAFIVLLIAVGAARLGKFEGEEALVRERHIMFRAMSVIGSILIAIVGFYWFVERAFL